MQVITGCGLPWARCSNKSSFSKTNDQSNEQINWTCPPCELLSPDDSWDGAAELPRERPGVQEKAPMGNGWMNKTIFHRCFLQHYQKMLRRKVASKQRHAQGFSVVQKMSPGSGFTRVKKRLIFIHIWYSNNKTYEKVFLLNRSGTTIIRSLTLGVCNIYCTGGSSGSCSARP